MRRLGEHARGSVRAIRGPAERLRRLASVAALLSAASVIVTTVAFDAAAAPSSKTASPDCLAQGARYAEGDKTTTTYEIQSIKGVTCAFARSWVARLTYQRVQADKSLSGGPPGWICGSLGRGRASTGFCQKSGGGYFWWKPKFIPVAPVRVYDVDVTGYETRTSKSARQERLRVHWTQTVPGLRLVVKRERKGQWERAFFRITRGKGSVEKIVDETDAPLTSVDPLPCPAPKTYRYPLHFLVWGQGPAQAAIAFYGEIPRPPAGQSPPDVACPWVDVDGRGPLHRDERSTPWGKVYSGLDLQFKADYMSMVFPGVRQGSGQFVFPMDRIVAGRSFVITEDFRRDLPNMRLTSTVKIVFTRKG
jgi:hypothetical protein